MELSLPNNWSPRHYQANTWNALGQVNKEGGLRRILSIWHRRAGKDDTYLHHNACAAFERVGNYWYMLPEYGQCRKAIWDAINPHTGKKRIDEAFPDAIRENTLNDEMKIIFKNGSTFQLMGSDRYDALVGSPPVGLTYSEWPLSNPASWGYLRPILLENDGWGAFNGTPRGKNHAWNMLNMAQESEDWFCEVLPADVTGVFTEEQLKKELDEMISEHGETYGRALWLQEYFCSFDAAMPGAVWGEAITELENAGRVAVIPHTEGYPVHSAWDLGHDDDTAIWFYQVVGNSLHVIDFVEKNNVDIDWYVDCLAKLEKERNYVFGIHWLPHDARPKRLGMGGRTVLQQFIDLTDDILKRTGTDLGNFSIVPNMPRQEGIQAARKTFKAAKFDSLRCGDALEHLRMYRRKYDDDKKIFTKDPVHDMHSHASDAWRYLSLTWQLSKEKQFVASPQQQLIDGNVTHITMGQIRDHHMKNAKKKRSELFL